MKEGDKCKVQFADEEAPEILTYIKSDRGFLIFKNTNGAKVVARENSLVKLEKV